MAYFKMVERQVEGIVWTGANEAEVKDFCGPACSIMRDDSRLIVLRGGHSFAFVMNPGDVLLRSTPGYVRFVAAAQFQEEFTPQEVEPMDPPKKKK